MADYISGSDLIAFTNIDSLAAADTDALEANIILRTKLMIDKHCFTDFEDADTGTDDYAKLQLAQKIMCERLWIKDGQDAKISRLAVGKGGSEKKTDWQYSLGESEEVINDEVAGYLEDLRDWSKSKSGRPVTGKIINQRNPIYASKINSRRQNSL